MRRAPAMGQFCWRSQKERARKAGRDRRPSPLFRLASPERMCSHKPPRPAQVLWMRKVRTWSPNVPSSREGLSPSPRTGARLGLQSSPALACYVNTPPSSKVLRTVSILESRQYAAPMPQKITIPSSTSSWHIMTSWSASSQPADTLVPSRASKWRPTWALFKHPLYPSSPKHPSQGSSEQCTISLTRTTPCPKQHQSTCRLMAITSRALGVPSLPSPSLSPASPQIHKPPCVTSRRRTEPSPLPLPNGPDSSSACNRKTSLPSTCATTSASPQPEVYTDLWQTLGQIYSGEMASAHWQSGSMTKFSPMPMQTSTQYQSASEFGGRCRNQSPSGGRSLTSVFAGTYALALYTCSRRKRRSTWLQSQNGNLSARTTSSKRRSYM